MPWGLRIYILRRPVEAKGKPRKEPTNADTDNVGGVATESCLIKCVIGHLVLNQVCFSLCREIGEDSGWRPSSCTFSRKTQSDCTWLTPMGKSDRGNSSTEAPPPQVCLVDNHNELLQEPWSITNDEERNHTWRLLSGKSKWLSQDLLLNFRNITLYCWDTLICQGLNLRLTNRKKFSSEDYWEALVFRWIMLDIQSGRRRYQMYY